MEWHGIQYLTPSPPPLPPTLVTIIIEHDRGKKTWGITKPGRKNQWCQKNGVTILWNGITDHWPLTTNHTITRNRKRKTSHSFKPMNNTTTTTKEKTCKKFDINQNREKFHLNWTASKFRQIYNKFKCCTFVVQKQINRFLGKIQEKENIRRTLGFLGKKIGEITEDTGMYW